MALGKIFYLLKDAELQAGELYALIGLSIAIVHPDLSDLFNDLAKEEELHSKQIELLRNIFLQSEDAFLENPEAEKMIVAFIHNLKKTKDNFNQNHAQMQPCNLVGLALDLERDLVENHRLFFMKAADPKIKSLLENLNLADAGHIQKLKDFPLA
jgi:rubrerythrin